MVDANMAQGQAAGIGLSKVLGGYAGKQYDDLVGKRQIHMKVLESGVGVEFDPRTGQMKFPHWANTPEEKALAYDGYVKKAKEAQEIKMGVASKFANMLNTLGELGAKSLKSVEDSAEYASETGDYSRLNIAKNNIVQLQRSVAFMLTETMPPEKAIRLYNSLPIANLDKHANSLATSKEWHEGHKNIVVTTANALVSTYLNPNDRSEDTLMAYSAIYNKNRKHLDGMIDPVALRKGHPTKEEQVLKNKDALIQKEKEQRQQIEVAREYPKPATNKLGLLREINYGTPEQSAKSQNLLNQLVDLETQSVAKSTKAQVQSKLSIVDVEGLADMISGGRLLIDDVPNTFGLPVKEYVRAELIKKDPGYNFIKARVTRDSIKSSVAYFEKRRGMTEAYVTNLDKQIDKAEIMSQTTINRFGTRAIDLPLKELIKRAKGSGAEQAYQIFLTEISNEAARLSAGDPLSIAELSTQAQERWDRMHDGSLSIPEIKKVLDATKHLGALKIATFNDLVDKQYRRLDDITTGHEASNEGNAFELISVE